VAYEDLRAHVDPTGALSSVPDSLFLGYVADHKLLDGAPPPQSNGWDALVSGVKGIPKDLAAVGKAGLGVAASTFGDIGNLSRVMTAPTPEGPAMALWNMKPSERASALGGAALAAGGPAEGMAGELAAKAGLKGLAAKVAAGAGVWGPAGALESIAAGRTSPGQVAGSAALSGGVGALMHGMAGEPRPAMEPPTAPPPEGTMIARSGIGPLVSDVKTRLSGLGPQGHEIRNKIEAAVQQSQSEPGQYLEPFSAALQDITKGTGSHALTNDQRSALLGVLERQQNPGTVPENLLPVAQQMGEYFGGTGQRATGLGVTVEGKPFKPLPDYFPHHAPTVDELSKSTDLQAAMARNLQDLGVAKSPEEADALVQDQLKFVKSQGKHGGQLATRAIAAMNPDASPEALRNALLNPKPKLRQPGSSLEFSRTINSPFYDPRPDVVFPRHVVETEKALAEIQHYGQDASKLTGLWQALPPEKHREAEWLIRTATESHEAVDPRFTKALGALRNLQLSAFSPGTTYKNVTQRANNLLTSDVPEFAAHGMVPTKAAEKTAARSGALAEGAHENLAQALGNEPGVMGKYLKTIGFTPVERGNRRTASETGIKEAQKYAARLAKNPNDRVAAYRLARAGVPGATGALTDQQGRLAALNRSNLAQFRSHPLDLPDWFTSHPLGRTLSLFKGFDYQQTKLVLDETLGRLGSGQPGDVARGVRNLAIVAAVYPAIGETVNDVYGLLFNREKPKETAARTKAFIEDVARTASGKMTPPQFAKKYVGRYGEDMLAGAAPGTGGALVQAAQFGKGDRGGSIAKYLAGPVVSRTAEAGQLASDLGGKLAAKGGGGKPKKTEMTPAEKRQILRLTLGGMGSLAGAWMYPSNSKKKAQ
jgi:hypothetical protein